MLVDRQGGQRARGHELNPRDSISTELENKALADKSDKTVTDLDPLFDTSGPPR